MAAVMFLYHPEIITLVKPFKVKPNVTLNLSKGATLLATRNTNVVQLRLNASIKGGKINTYYAEKFDSSVIYLDGKDHFSIKNHSSAITDIQIIRKHDGDGIAVEFNSENDEDSISWVSASNLNISGFEKGIYLKTTQVSESELAWVNGNTFDQVHISDCEYGIYLDGHTSIPYEVAGNSFTNVQIQISERTLFGIFVKGNRNYFQVTLWDNKNKEAVKFDIDSYRNKLESNIKPDGLINLGKENSISYY
ncbi:hypothetical protein KEH51_14700 [[Brevibacterium] frigoritolerans]|uniref:Uncharacterized protein n=1 Tax=Peribacillus frigoritolerans TaxID=450367 RepID=A0A941J2T4_9BACI|nr:hypothetical protein [Peribacillus frigoritolerans]